MIIATFNIQNMRLKPDGRSGRLTGARDLNREANVMAEPDLEQDHADRLLTAKLIHQMDADIIALQEVFDIATLDHFHTHYLQTGTGFRPYPYRISLPGNDGRGQDVALMSRQPPRIIESHASLTVSSAELPAPAWMTDDRRLFCRDCLRVTIDPLTLYVCHFKSPNPDPEIAWDTRFLEARMVRRIVERDFEDPARALWLVLGDFNDPDMSNARGQSAIRPLSDGFCVDLMMRLPEDERWSVADPATGQRYRPDGFFASPAFAERWPDAVPTILRSGTGTQHPRASDHAAISIELHGI